MRSITAFILPLCLFAGCDLREAADLPLKSNMQVQPRTENIPLPKLPAPTPVCTTKTEKGYTCTTCKTQWSSTTTCKPAPKAYFPGG